MKKIFHLGLLIVELTAKLAKINKISLIYDVEMLILRFTLFFQNFLKINYKNQIMNLNIE